MKTSMSYILPTIAILLILLTFSCKSKQKAQATSVIKKELTEQEVRTLPKIIEYSKSPCYGRCPTFKMTVYQDGWTIFEGKRFTIVEDTLVMQLTPAQLATLTEQCDKADFWTAEKSYGMRIQDLPTTTVHLYEEGKDKTIQWRARQPERLKNFDKQMMGFVIEQGWVAPRKRSDKRKREVLPDVIIDNELIIQIEDTKEATEWALQYKEYGMQLKKPISKLANMYLFTFDVNTIDSKKMLALMKEDKTVKRVEFNKRMQKRTR